MSHIEPFRVGRIEVGVVCEGFAPLPIDDECPGRRVDWDAERARHPWSFHGDRAWPWHVHAFVLRTPEGITVVDTGVGAFGPYRPWAAHDPSAWSGLDLADVRHVILTHLHADHAGGSMADDLPRFPNATYHVHPGDRTFFAGAGEEDYVAREAMASLEAAARLDLTPLDHEVAPGVEVRHSPGHTPGHRSVVVRDADEALLLTGDLLHLPVQAAHPEWPSSHDIDPALGSASRQLLLFLVRHEGWRVGVSHFARPFGTVSEEGWRADDAPPDDPLQVDPSTV